MTFQPQFTDLELVAIGSALFAAAEDPNVLVKTHIMSAMERMRGCLAQNVDSGITPVTQTVSVARLHDLIDRFRREQFNPADGKDHHEQGVRFGWNLSRKSALALLENLLNG